MMKYPAKMLALKAVRHSALLFAVVCFVASPLLAATPSPQIENTTINYATTPNRITIIGKNLAPKKGLPDVVLNGEDLGLISSTSTSVVAYLPSDLAPGSYMLSLNTGSDNNLSDIATFVVTLGAVGP